LIVIRGGVTVTTGAAITRGRGRGALTTGSDASNGDRATGANRNGSGIE